MKNKKIVMSMLSLALGMLVSLTLRAEVEAQVINIDIDESAKVTDSAYSVLGINHIGLSVKDLDAMLGFYRQATGFELVSREQVANNDAADTLYGHKGLVYERAVIKAPNMMFELIEFTHNHDAVINDMPAQGPGMTHTCFQSPEADPGYTKFMQAGAKPLSRGDGPVDLGGYGVTYAYAHDPEGNMFEMEQLDGEILSRAGYDSTWQEDGERLWMSQVGIATHNIERLMKYYQSILGFKPYRVREVGNNPRIDAIANIDDLHLIGGWFKMNHTSKVMEFWQYLNPATPVLEGPRKVTDLGYSFSIEVGDLESEYNRLKQLGVAFVSEPVELSGYLQVYANDIDGNVFALRQAIDPTSLYSVRQFDLTGVAH